MVFCFTIDKAQFTPFSVFLMAKEFFFVLSDFRSTINSVKDTCVFDVALEFLAFYSQIFSRYGGLKQDRK